MQTVRRGTALCSLPLAAAAVGGAAAIALGSDDDSGINGRVVPVRHRARAPGAVRHGP